MGKASRELQHQPWKRAATEQPAGFDTLGVRTGCDMTGIVETMHVQM